MRRYFVFTILFTGILSVLSQTLTIDSTLDRFQKQNLDDEKRIMCPVGFIRRGKFCYYLSAGTASWQEAHFHCKDRNSTLAILDKPGKNRVLRRLLMDNAYRRLERWIGGIYNWQNKAWVWAMTGARIEYQNFSKKPRLPSHLAWNCIIMDPALKYKWNARKCIEKKYYVCETAAARRGRSNRREMINDPSAPLSSVRRDKKKQKDRPRKKGRKQLKSKKSESSVWLHGVKLGSRPPTRDPQVSSDEPQKPYSFQGLTDQHKPHSLNKNTLYTLNNKINDFAVEEILLKT